MSAGAVIDSFSLKPRAVALLVCLRVGSLTVSQVRSRISDANLADTKDLVGDMVRLGLVNVSSAVYAFVSLSDDGKAWLQRNGVI